MPSKGASASLMGRANSAAKTSTTRFGSPSDRRSRRSDAARGRVPCRLRGLAELGGLFDADKHHVLHLDPRSRCSGDNRYRVAQTSQARRRGGRTRFARGLIDVHSAIRSSARALMIVGCIASSSVVVLAITPLRRTSSSRWTSISNGPQLPDAPRYRLPSALRLTGQGPLGHRGHFGWQSPTPQPSSLSRPAHRAGRRRVPRAKRRRPVRLTESARSTAS